MSSKLSLKLVIDTKAQKVLFAEAGKEVVDFLFSLMAMPLGSIIKLLTKDQMVGCIASLYESLKSMDDAYLQTTGAKSELLNPRVLSAPPPQATLFLPPRGPMVVKHYKCPNSGHNYFTDARGTACPICIIGMALETGCVDPLSRQVVVNPGEGYVKGVVMYVVMDDLTVTPILSLTLFNKLHVKDMSALQEKTVELGMEEALQVLKASFQSTTVLTDVFLRSSECAANKSLPA